MDYNYTSSTYSPPYSQTFRRKWHPVVLPVDLEDCTEEEEDKPRHGKGDIAALEGSLEDGKVKTGLGRSTKYVQ